MTNKLVLLGAALSVLVGTQEMGFADGGRRLNGLSKDVAVRHRRLPGLASIS